MERRSQVRRARMMHLFFFAACLRRIKALHGRPLLFEQAASVENLGRNRGARVHQLRLLWTFFPHRAEITRGTVLINRLKVPPQEDRRQWEPVQEFFKVHPPRVSAPERSEPAKRGEKLRVKLPEQLHLRRCQIALRCRAHDYNHTNEPLVFPKKEAPAVSAFLRRHVAAIEGRFHQTASIRKDVANPHKPVTRSPSDITLERRGIKKTIRHGQCPSCDHWQNWIVLKR